MKTIKYTLLITSFLFVLCCLSCKDEEIDDPDCCAGLPGMLSLHVSDIEGVGTSEKERKDFLSKVSMYYFSKTGVKTPVPLTGTRYRDGTFTEFSELKKLILIKNQDYCKFNAENCLSLRSFPLEIVQKKKIERFYLQIKQDVDTIDLAVRYIPEGYIEHRVTNIRVNGKNLNPVGLAEGGSDYDHDYYFSKTGKKPKITCPSE